MEYGILNGIKRTYSHRTKVKITEVLSNYKDMKYIGTTNEFEENNKPVIYDEPYHLFVDVNKSENNFY